MICEKAGVKNIGAINYHFQGKDRLYLEAVKRALSLCCPPPPANQMTGHLSAEGQLRFFIRDMLQVMAGPGDEEARQLWMRELQSVEPSKTCSAAVEASIVPQSKVLHSILSKLIPEANESRRWQVGFSIVGQCLFYCQNRAIVQALLGKPVLENFDIEQLADHVNEFCLAGVKAVRKSLREAKS